MVFFLSRPTPISVSAEIRRYKPLVSALFAAEAVVVAVKAMRISARHLKIAEFDVVAIQIGRRGWDAHAWIRAIAIPKNTAGSEANKQQGHQNNKSCFHA
jgi:hypothetical protein